MPSTVITITHAAPVTNVVPAFADSGEVEQACQQGQTLLNAIACGAFSASVDIATSSATPTQASGQITISSGSGSITATINGVAIAVAWGTSDTATAAALAAAINASSNALVSGIVTASSALGVVTITAIDKSKTGNAITLAASGTGASASGARLTGGAGDDAAATTYSGNL